MATYVLYEYSLYTLTRGFATATVPDGSFSRSTVSVLTSHTN